MAKTPNQIEAERKQKIEERRRYLIENPSIYRKELYEAFKEYLTRTYPDGLDLEDCYNRFDPEFKEEFTWSPEGRELSLKYSLNRVWDPDGDNPPSPFIGSAARKIRRQDDRIWLNQIQKDSIINLPPDKMFGRFLIAEIDLSKPKRQIKADIMALVDNGKKKLKVTGSHHDLVSLPEHRDRDSSFTYKPMEVWKMVEEERRTHDEEEKALLWRIATTKTSKTINSYDGETWNREIRRIYEALCNAYGRDKSIYYGN